MQENGACFSDLVGYGVSHNVFVADYYTPFQVYSHMFSFISLTVWYCNSLSFMSWGQMYPTFKPLSMQKDELHFL
jgi:hypothetical protein